MKIFINLVFDYDEQASQEVMQAIDDSKVPMDEYIDGFIQECFLDEYQTVDGENISYTWKVEE